MIAPLHVCLGKYNNRTIFYIPFYYQDPLAQDDLSYRTAEEKESLTLFYELLHLNVMFFEHSERVYQIRDTDDPANNFDFILFYF